MSSTADLEGVLPDLQDLFRGDSPGALRYAGLHPSVMTKAASASRSRMDTHSEVYTHRPFLVALVP